MPAARSIVIAIGERIPNNLSVFVGAIFLANSVNTFTSVFGGSSIPHRAPVLMASCLASLLAAALWTTFASKLEQIEKTAISAAQDLARQDVVRAELWNELWLRLSVYLTSAALASVFALVILMVHPGS